MEIGVPSRFACLNIEDEELSVQSAKPKEPKKKVKTPVVTEPPKLPNKKPDKKCSTKTNTETKHLNKQMSVVSKKGKKKQAQQWDEWKQKDDELENGLYEEDLRNAILLSKLDFEQNKEVYNKQADEKAKHEIKKTKKNKTISLDKFLNHDLQKETSIKISSSSKTNCIDTKQSDFFNSLDSETKVEIKKDQINVKRKKREANINEVISLAQYQEKYEEEHRLRLAAESQLKKFQEAYESADAKLKTLCKVINHGQLKDKAAILLENRQLTIVKNDLTDSIANLNASLEKERSKVATLTAALNKSGKPKDKKRKGN